MDANDKKGGDTNLQKLLNKHDLMDAHKQLHHHYTQPNTYQRGQEQINYVFITPALALALLSAGHIIQQGNAKCIGTKRKKPSRIKPSSTGE
eukprot:11327869-Ditylum_brightwellii.AAC.1